MSEDATLPPALPDRETLPRQEAGASAAPPGYEILGELGRGGMGVVYRARHAASDRAVALKMILAGGHAAAGDVARFRTEAQAIARLQHPGIVQVFDVGEHEGRPYFSLELCDGGSLAEKLASNPLPPREAAEMVERLARAVQAAHEAGVIHRDLKPANVLLSDKGEPKVTDFGLARKLDDVGQTQTGSVMGTPSYMAPEQAAGRKDVGPLADVYALGAILYECLVGRPPFKAATAFDTIMQVVEDDPPPPRQFNRKVPRDLETVALKCLAKAPAGRYASAADLADDLRRWQDGEPIRARPAGVVERAAKWVCRRPAAAGLMAVSVLALAAILGGGAWFTWQLDRARKDAQKKAEEALERLAHSEGARYAQQISSAEQAIKGWELGRAEALLVACKPDQRGWEHHYLMTQLRQRMWPVEVPASAGPPAPFELSPDGKQLAVGGKEARVVDALTSRPLLSLGNKEGFIEALAFSRDGLMLATSSGKLIHIWEVATGKRMATLEGHLAPARQLAFAADGTLFSAGAEKAVRVWNVDARKVVRSLPAPADVFRFAVSPDGRRVAVLLDAGENRPRASAALAGKLEAVSDRGVDGNGPKGVAAERIVLLDTATGKAVRDWPAHSLAVADICFSPDGNTLASCGINGAVSLWNAESGVLRKQVRVNGDRYGAHCLVFLRGGPGDPKVSLVISGGLAGLKRPGPTAVVGLGPEDSGKERLLWAHLGGVTRLSGGANRIATGDDAGGPIRIWEPGFDETFEILGGPDGDGDIAQSEFLADGKLLVSRNESAIAILDMNNRESGTSNIAVQGLSALAAHPDGKSLAAGTAGGGVNLLAVKDGKLAATLEGPNAPVSVLAFSPDGGRLAVGHAGEGACVRVWDVPERKALATIALPKGKPRALAFRPEGGTLAVACEDTEVRLFDSNTGAEKGRIVTGGPIRAAAFSPDGRWLVTAGSGDAEKGSELCLRAMPGGEIVHRLTGHEGGGVRLAFSHDGKRLASVAGDETLRLWSTATGLETFYFQTRSAPGSIALSPDGRHLVLSEGVGLALLGAEAIRKLIIKF